MSDCYCPDNGRPSWDPVILFKVVFLQFLYDLSDRQIEEQVNLHLACKWFVGLMPEEAAPDHSTICRFRARLGPEKFQEIFNTIIELARAAGLVHDRLRIIDATHVTVNSGRWTVTDHRSPVTADKGYDTNASHQKLKQRGQRSSIIIRKNRTDADIIGQADSKGQRDRPSIERKFAEQKKYHGLAKARYWGLAKVTIQALITCLVVNCKRMAKLLSACPIHKTPHYPWRAREGGEIGHREANICVKLLHEQGHVLKRTQHPTRRWRLNPAKDTSRSCHKSKTHPLLVQRYLWQQSQISRWRYCIVNRNHQN